MTGTPKHISPAKTRGASSASVTVSRAAAAIGFILFQLAIMACLTAIVTFRTVTSSEPVEFSLPGTPRAGTDAA